MMRERQDAVEDYPRDPAVLGRRPIDIGDRSRARDVEESAFAERDIAGTGDVGALFPQRGERIRSYAFRGIRAGEDFRRRSGRKPADAESE
jgi:hypothetical protein